MTETEWGRSTDCPAMLAHLDRVGVSGRKLRLAAVACSRLAWEHIAQEGREVLLVAERVADGEASLSDLADVYPNRQDPEWLADARRWSFDVGSWACGLSERRFEDCPEMADVLREVFGPAGFADFGERPASRVDQGFGPAWLLACDGVVTRLAEAVYNDRGYERLPILADALEEAGCDRAVLLDHLRRPGGHLRGCWAVDLVLGKK